MDISKHISKALSTQKINVIDVVGLPICVTWMRQSEMDRHKQGGAGGAEGGCTAQNRV